MNQTTERNLALFAIFQVASCIKNIATSGNYDKDAAMVCFESLFNTEGASASEIFKSPDNLKLGSKSCLKFFDPKNKNKDVEIAKYVFSLLHLERKLIKNPKMMQEIKEGLLKAKKQLEFFSLDHSNVQANLAGIYTDTISTFNFRIHVSGKPFYLNNKDNANKIRALLLAGIRAARLWRQLGGSKWQLIFLRKQIIQDAKEYA